MNYKKELLQKITQLVDRHAGQTTSDEPATFTLLLLDLDGLILSKRR